MPSPRRWPRTLLALVVVALLAAGCSSLAHASGPQTATLSNPAPSGSAPPGPWHIVALGDSVTAGGPCPCTTFPQLYAQKLSYARGVRTTVQNLGVNGLDSAGLLASLRNPHSAATTAVRNSDIDLITIGANDFAPEHNDVTNGRCAGAAGAACVNAELAGMQRNVSAVLATIHQLRGSRPTAILVTGYWNVFEDGAVARRAFPAAGLRASRELTTLANDALRRAAQNGGATYVDLMLPFIGPRTGGDPTSLLGPDGDHPNAAGQDLIATRLLAAGLHGLTGP